MFFSNLCKVCALGPRILVQRLDNKSSWAESCAELSRITVRARLRNWRSMDSKREKRASECWSSLLMDSSRTERNSVNVLWRVWRVLWGEDMPKMEVAIEPRRVGVPDGVSKTPHRLSMVCRLS